MGANLSGAAIDHDSDPFSEGATRWAFRARVTKGTYEGYPLGTELVLKVIKNDCYERGIRLTEDDIKAQNLTRAYCELFNEKNYVNKKVYSRVGKLIKATENYYSARGKRNIVKGESMLLEQYIHGEYEKFNSNSGWSRHDISLPNFFSHWSWFESGGAHLVCDLQGHRGRPGGAPYGDNFDYYLFTDPVVLTNGPPLKFGCSDLGKKGILRWFELHKCNKLCTTFGLDKQIPQQEPVKTREETDSDNIEEMMGTSYKPLDPVIWSNATPSRKSSHDAPE